ncbi:MAG TPA: phosphatase PAP2 family protein [Acidimicrobiales bacterium]|nr:phosphatase PAP2 family protein [Acidimicrobiales bacterium]
MTSAALSPENEQDQPLSLIAPRRRPRWWGEALVIVFLTWAYDAITNLPAVRHRAAIRHGFDVLHLEQHLHIDAEHALDTWLHGHYLLGQLAGDYYDNIHFIVTFAIIGWLWWRHPEEYRPLRTALVLINVIGFLIFWLYPSAPPRLLPGQHYFDIVALTHAIGGWSTGPTTSVANLYAAMPSLHLGWATWSALAVWFVFRRRRWSLLVWLYPIVTTVDVLATGNHFLLDCVAGAATTAVSAAIAFGGREWWRRRQARREADRLPSELDTATA